MEAKDVINALAEHDRYNDNILVLHKTDSRTTQYTEMFRTGDVETDRGKYNLRWYMNTLEGRIIYRENRWDLCHNKRTNTYEILFENITEVRHMK